MTVSVSSERGILNPNSMTFEERQAFLNKQDEDSMKRARKSPFNNFVQFNKDMYKAEDWLMKESPIAYRIFKFLINNMDDYNAVICSQTVLQEQFEVSRATVSRALKLLKDQGYVAVFKSGTSNVYALNDKIVWKSWGTNYRSSKFPANVLLSLSEQEEKTKRVQHKEIVIK
ncbi:MAG: replication/maintenance protein RepL [Clostridium chrysemydis]|uniref:replication/maintenance protein RepL n=1 Tax=Clostridium chrysemydis TaxID=2665504 RepID=UPI003F2FBD7F